MIDISSIRGRCTGCGACANICAQNAIQLTADAAGFVYPAIELDKCVNCGLCDKVCLLYSNKNTANDDTPEVYAAWSLCENTRYTSTSGGIFTEIALKVIESGGYVVGARYNAEHMVEHYIINDSDQIDLLRQSKYIQSSINYVYRDVKRLLDDGRYVAFFGTPCQIIGLKKFLIKKYDNLLAVDFICRGVNSPKALASYISYLEKKYISKVTRIWFKNKTYGWNRFSTRVDFKNKCFYIKDRYNDLFMRGYLEHNIFMRNSCYDCICKGYNESDITLGDFWGISSKDKNLDEDKGTSIVIVNTQRGKETFRKLASSVFSTAAEYEYALYGNACLTYSPLKNKNKDAFLESLDRMPFDKAFHKYCGIRNRQKYLYYKGKLLNKLSAAKRKLLTQNK